jgi:hypothetical protein
MYFSKIKGIRNKNNFFIVYYLFIFFNIFINYMGKTSNGGIMGSGVSGVVGTAIVCNSTDTSLYCQIMKLFNVLMVLLSFIFIGYMIYTYFFTSYFSPKKRRK